MQTEIHDTIKGQVQITFTEPVSYRCLFLNLLRIPLRNSAKDGSAPPMLPVLATILLRVEGSGTLCGFEPLKQDELDWFRHSPIRPDGFHLHWTRPLSHRGPPIPPGPAGMKRLVDTFFGLLKSAGYANSLNPKSGRLHESDDTPFGISCDLFSDQLVAVGKEVSRTP
jgi:hypothetical protein